MKVFLYGCDTLFPTSNKKVIFSLTAMESLKRQLDIIKEKFPQQNVRIEALYETDEDFRSLCSDYLLCLEHLEKFKKEYGEKQLSIKEFQDLRTELETELFNFITETS